MAADAIISSVARSNRLIIIFARDISLFAASQYLGRFRSCQRALPTPFTRDAYCRASGLLRLKPLASTSPRAATTMIGFLAPMRAAPRAITTARTIGATFRLDAPGRRREISGAMKEGGYSLRRALLVARRARDIGHYYCSSLI